MMRGPSAWSVAVRKPDGEIAEVNRPISSFLLRHRWARIPIVRGVFALGESLSIGFRALAISANYAAQEESEDGEVQTELSRGQLIFAFGIAIGFALLLFKVSPALITSWLPIESTGAFVVVEGLVRVTIFILYIVGVGSRSVCVLARLAPLDRELVRPFELLHPPPRLGRGVAVRVERRVVHALLRLDVGALELVDQVLDGSGHHRVRIAPRRGGPGVR